MKLCHLLASLTLAWSLPTLAAPAPAPAGQTLFNFVRPSEALKISGDNASLPQQNAEATVNGEALRRVVFNPSVRPTLHLTPAGGSWDWSGSGLLSLRLQSGMDWALTVHLSIKDSSGKTLESRIDLPAGPAQTVLVPLAASSSLNQGMRAGPPMPWAWQDQRVLLAESQGQVDLAHVASIDIYLERPNVPQSLFIERLGVQPGDEAVRAAYSHLVDQYGQFTRGRWPEKVTNDEGLKASRTRENAQLKGWLQERGKLGLDEFGGWKGGPSFKTDGFFRTEKHDGRWYLVTPAGNPFYSLGVNTVTFEAGKTYVAGREWMFDDLPKPDVPMARFYGDDDSRDGNRATAGLGYNNGRWFDFYAANLARVDDKPCVAAGTCQAPEFDAGPWQQRTLDRLLGWGFNTLGNWSDPGLGDQQRVPYTLPLSIVGDYASISTGLDWWGRIPDPFDPRFAMAAERAVAIATRDHRDDPWLIGYFADNELAWAGAGADPQARYGLALGTLKLTTDVPAKRAFLKQLRDKYRNQEGLSKAWGVQIPAWEQMEDPGFQAPLPDPAHPEIEADYQHFQQVFAETYFKTIRDSLKFNDPNHLLLGGRYGVNTPEAIKACARYCDVLSFNYYTLRPQDGQGFAELKALDKPVLISEFNFATRDRGPFWSGQISVAKEEDRGPAYEKYLKAALSDTQIVGVHWFQFLDEPVSGRLLDGENGHFGLVGITDVPYQGFIETVRRANLAALAQLRKGL